jgi:NitT/TauT family transport system permease protein
MTNIKKILTSKQVVTLVWIIAIFIIWEIGATSIEHIKRTPENVLPHISQIIASVFSTKPVSNNQTALQIVLSNAGDTLCRAGIGFLIGMISGFMLALLMNMFHAVEKVAFPYLMIIQMVPILGMAPIVLAITRDIGISRIVIAAILTFYPVSTNVLAGFKSVEKEKHELMYSYAASKFQLYTKTLIPASIPYFFTGLKISAPMAITASILVDTLQGDGGLGCMLSQSLKHAMSIYVFWQIVFLSSIIGILSYYLMDVLEKLILPTNRKVKLKKKVSVLCHQYFTN